jgi:DNA invertase Pin-like site-specific DNA recombinase
MCVNENVLIGYANRNGQLTIVQQVELLERAGCNFGDVYKEEFVRASTPELKKAIRALRSGDVLVVAKMICLATSRKQLASVLRHLKEYDINFWSIDDRIDTREKNGEMVLPALLEFIQKRHDVMSELTLDGLKKATAEGRLGGRPTVLSIEKWDEAAQLLALNQFSIADVAKRLGIARGTLYNAGLAGSRKAASKGDRPRRGTGKRKKTTR